MHSTGPVTQKLWSRTQSMAMDAGKDTDDMEASRQSKKRRGWQRIRWLDSTTDSMDMTLSKLWSQWRAGKPGVLQFMGFQG